MPVQNTFTLVPTAASIAARSPATVRPMTSKQVTKAYKAANRMPKMSRAERMKQERAEQERIRTELERKKSAAKARAVRDKKKEQERAEQEERKRNGRPLIDVRASQNTMTSFFTRGPVLKAQRGPFGRPLDVVEEEEDVTIEDEERQEQQRPPDETAEDVAAFADRPDSPKNKALDELMPDDIDDADFDLLLETNAVDLDTLVDTTCPKHQEPQEKPFKSRSSLKSSPVEPSRPETQYERDLGLKLAKKRKRDDSECEKDLKSDIDEIKPVSPEQSAVSMAPPPRPSPPRPPPPLSTQYIMYDFDDFFPTASQQIRELEEEEVVITRQRAPLRASPQPLHQDRIPSPPEQLHPSAPNSPPAAPKSPKRFFTASGSQEGMSLALHRSRRTAALEALQQKDRMRIEAGILQQQQELLARRERADQAKKMKNAQSRVSADPTPLQQTLHNTAVVEKQAVAHVDKENIPPQILKKDIPVTSSQETDYGGRWLDEIPLDIDF